jgi:hypothetical protein
MTRKNSLQDSLNTLKPIFYFWNSLFQIVCVFWQILCYSKKNSYFLERNVTFLTIKNPMFHFRNLRCSSVHHFLKYRQWIFFSESILFLKIFCNIEFLKICKLGLWWVNLEKFCGMLKLLFYDRSDYLWLIRRKINYLIYSGEK